MPILKAVSLGALHGYGILLRIQQISGERLEILQGSFYTAIYRLERRSWIKGEWGESENNRRARFYSLNRCRYESAQSQDRQNGPTWLLLSPPFSARRRTRYESPRRNSQALALHRATHP
jgi:hypothetical protein